jgi:hypothetical protein
MNLKNIAMKNTGIILLILFLLSACEEYVRGPMINDEYAPSPIINPVVVNTPGGAEVSYNLPDETDLLYVVAEYTLSNGEKYETRSSIFINVVIIEGYGDTLKHEVTLYTVDRSENKSASVIVEIQPLTPPVKLVQESISVTPDFGGVLFTWENPTNAPLVFEVLAIDSTGTLSTIETVYSGITEGRYSLRGFDPVETEFGIIIRDKWFNYSDTISLFVTPMFEFKLDKLLFSNADFPGDTDMNGWEGRFEYAFDDDISTFNHSLAGTGWPQFFTIDLGVLAKLSRVNIIQRQDERFLYGHGNPRLFEIWGTNDYPSDSIMYPDEWYLLKECVAMRPTEQGGTADEDALHVLEGDEFTFTIDDPPFRYIRVLVNETWGNTGFIHFAEIEFWGQIIED